MTENYQTIEKPPDTVRAFYGSDPASLVTQGAFFLALGSLLHPEWRQHVYASEEERRYFRLPSGLGPVEAPFGPNEFVAFRNRFGPTNRLQSDHDHWTKVAGSIVEDLFRRPEPSLAAYALIAGMRSSSELVRLCASISFADHFYRGWEMVNGRIWMASGSQDSLVRKVAAAAIARVHRTTEPYADEDFPPPPIPTGRTCCVLVNGTLPWGTSINNGQPEAWWRPGGDLNRHLRTGARPDVTFFEWGGGYNVVDHRLSARAFCDWRKKASPQLELDVVTHSHGGNMAMRATELGLRIRKLLLLSCPVRWEQHEPNWANIAAAQSVRIHCDLVLLVDRSRQTFPPNTVPEFFLPYWFHSHSDSHKSAVWVRHNIDRFV